MAEWTSHGNVGWCHGGSNELMQDDDDYIRFSSGEQCWIACESLYSDELVAIGKINGSLLSLLLSLIATLRSSRSPRLLGQLRLVLLPGRLHLHHADFGSQRRSANAHIIRVHRGRVATTLRFWQLLCQRGSAGLVLRRGRPLLRIHERRRGMLECLQRGLCDVRLWKGDRV